MPAIWALPAVGGSVSATAYAPGAIMLGGNPAHPCNAGLFPDATDMVQRKPDTSHFDALWPGPRGKTALLALAARVKLDIGISNHRILR